MFFGLGSLSQNGHGIAQLHNAANNGLLDLIVDQTTQPKAQHSFTTYLTVSLLADALMIVADSTQILGSPTLSLY